MTDVDEKPGYVVNLSRFHAEYNLDLSIATRWAHREAVDELQSSIFRAVSTFLDRVEGSEAS